MTNIISSLNVIDFILLGFIGLGLLIGVKKGLSTMISKLLSLAVMVLAVLYYYSTAAEWLSSNSPLPERSAQAIVYVVLTLVGWTALDIAFKLFGKVMEVKFSEKLSRFGGFFLGGLWMFLIGGFILYSLMIFKAPFLDLELAKSSYLAPRVSQLPGMAYEFVFREPPQKPSV